MEIQDREKSPVRRSSLVVVPFLILAGLLAAPPTRMLLLANMLAMLLSLLIPALRTAATINASHFRHE